MAGIDALIAQIGNIGNYRDVNLLKDQLRSRVQELERERDEQKEDAEVAWADHTKMAQDLAKAQIRVQELEAQLESWHKGAVAAELIRIRARVQELEAALRKALRLARTVDGAKDKSWGNHLAALEVKMVKNMPGCMMPDGAAPCAEFQELAAERDRYMAALKAIGFTPEGQPVVGTSNRSARANFERVTRLAREALRSGSEPQK